VKVLIRQFLGKNHSWSIVGWGIANALIKQGHQVHLFSTDGIRHLPQNLKQHIVGFTEENQPTLFGNPPDKEYDCQISYTAMKNFPFLLANGTKNRFGIWCYEWFGSNVLPVGFAKHYKSCDWLISPSTFVRDEIFVPSGIPVDAIKVIPHGIDVDQYAIGMIKNQTIPLPTKKSFKLLANVAQNHVRKNIPGMLEAYGRAFTDKDDVCLILKGKDKPVTAPFEISLNDCLRNFNRKFPRHAEVKVYSEFLPDISSLYRSVDCVYTMSYGEGFYFPGLEGLAAGKMSIAPDHGGHRDFLNDQNSLLVKSTAERANPKSMYWDARPGAMWYKPDIEDAVQKLRYAAQNFQTINQTVVNQQPYIYETYNWSTITSQILSLCHSS
jgi:glycosyltransferase involved in cell wall biosynthesis